ncbi:peptidoglycan DD-metalloendopeptidase family protein [uncultured Capnocytophaga sp.]|uniref:murein hydrolase activator EnvC family protein n=1 Tax=uncultured Capnocytophaga sp. TaxID=159273 RepID=UPI002605E138|nr:peptidoglycan DD-metalloendopeptidase family protein [uncultured Capnocytophaga sp.]
MHRLVVFICILSFAGAFAQTSQKQKQLERQKKALMEQIREMSALRSQQAQERKSLATQIEEISEKISARTQLIRVTNHQANLLSQQIKENQDQMANLKKELEVLKKNYAAVIEQSYKTRSPQSRWLLLLASESFAQGYKRLRYLQQYSQYRKKQAQEIQEKNTLIQQLTDSLSLQHSYQRKIVEENKKEQDRLSQERKTQETLVASIKKKESEYADEIKKKQAQANKIDKEIDRLIRLAIAEANKKGKTTTTGTTSGKTSSDKVFDLTPEGQALSSDFEANKGKLIWPIERGYKSQGFGTYDDPVYPDLKHYNNGITLMAPRNSDARCVFNGEVSAIISVPGGNKAVQVRHGNFITIYYNLIQVYVSKGQKVSAKTPLGKIFTDSEGRTEMKFFVYKNTNKLNPEHWLRE